MSRGFCLRCKVVCYEFRCGVCAASVDQGITSTVDRVKAIINDTISNIDINRLLQLAQRSLDWRTYIDFTPSPRGSEDRGPSRPPTALGKARKVTDTAVNILFEVNEQ